MSEKVNIFRYGASFGLPVMCIYIHAAFGGPGEVNGVVLATPYRAMKHDSPYTCCVVTWFGGVSNLRIPDPLYLQPNIDTASLI